MLTIPSIYRAGRRRAAPMFRRAATRTCARQCPASRSMLGRGLAFRRCYSNSRCTSEYCPVRWVRGRSPGRGRFRLLDRVES